MPALSAVAAIVMDLYYQDYKGQEDFFQEEHFIFLCAAAYSSLLQIGFEKSKKQNYQEEGVFIPQLSADWYIQENITVESKDGEYTATLKNKVFSFQFDKSSSAIMDIVPDGCDCKDFIRMNFQQMWQLKHLPVTKDVYWAVVGNIIRFKNVKCGLSKATVLYIPQPSAETDINIPDSMVSDITQGVWSFMKQANQGILINMTNDQNANKVAETELAKHLRTQ